MIDMSTANLYAQRNPVHAANHYGLPQAAASSMIGRYGCKLCDYALVLGILPAALQDLFASNGCYANDLARWYNYILDEQVAALFADRLRYDGRVDCPTKPAPLDLIDSLLAANGWCLVYVDARQNMTPDIRINYRDYFQHYILLLEKSGANYRMFDPFVGDIALLSPRYGATAAFAIGGVIKLAKKIQPAPIV